MHAFEFSIPTQIVFGPGTEARTGELAAGLGASPGPAGLRRAERRRSGLLDRVEQSLTQAGLICRVFAGIHPNPRLFQVREGIQAALEFGADLVLAVGGGSVIDAAKAIALGAAEPEADLWDFWLGKRPVERPLPVGAVLTISAARERDQLLRRAYPGRHPGEAGPDLGSDPPPLCSDGSGVDLLSSPLPDRLRRGGHYDAHPGPLLYLCHRQPAHRRDRPGAAAHSDPLRAPGPWQIPRTSRP